jgi:hypothetical protein
MVDYLAGNRIRGTDAEGSSLGTSFPSGLSKTGLKAYWRFDESSGDIINQATSVGSSDSLGSSADMQVTGATYGVTGAGDGAFLGTALSFDGSNDRAVAGTSTSQFDFLHNSTTMKWSVCFWAKIEATSTCTILDTTAVSSVNNGFTVWTDGGKLHCQIMRSVAGQRVLHYISSASYVPSSEWNFYAITYDQTLGSNNMTVTRDNANQETSSKTAYAPNTGNALDAMTIGEASDLSGNYRLNGDIQEVSIWDRVLTSSEITSIYQDINSKNYNIIDGSIFYATDTNKSYVLNSGTWTEV